LAGIVEGPNCADAVWADFNNDRYPDLLCAGVSLPGADPQRFWINRGNGTFVDVAPTSGINDLGRNAAAVTFLDKDGDGDLDAYFGCEAWPFGGFPNAILDVLLENNGVDPPQFTDVALASGIDETAFPRDANAVGSADYDLDLFQDILVVGSGSGFEDDDYFWRNISNTNQALRVRLVGTVSNTWGIGADVTVIPDYPGTDAPTEAQCLAASSAFAVWHEVVGGSLNQNSMELEFGLGTRPIDVRQVDCVNVFWPRSGLRRGFPQVATDSPLEIREDAPGLKVTRVTPAAGPTAGGTTVMVIGFNFDPASAQVFFDNLPANVVAREGTNIITVTTPANSAGPADVKVQNPTGSPDTLVGGYTYVTPGQEIDLRLAKDVPQGKVNLTWTDANQGTYYRVRRALGPRPADFSPAQFCTIVGGRSYADTVLNDGVNYYYLVDTTLSCP
jgi:hypothetical protein